jgi:hypothetical protein
MCITGTVNQIRLQDFVLKQVWCRGSKKKPPEFCVLVALEQARVVKIPRSQLAHCFQQSISWLFR